MDSAARSKRRTENVLLDYSLSVIKAVLLLLQLSGGFKMKCEAELFKLNLRIKYCHYPETVKIEQYLYRQLVRTVVVIRIF